ncbi:MAG: sigma 54-interacting transcriptional regulator, partial [Desulfovibrio fairfieldensis]|nr:sigma 54-interacting transcriptional regulator [Desulfovibrio fairfieldensis]
GIALQKAKAKARQYAQADAAILLHGETGVGKELFAHAIHNASPRRDEPFVAVNLAALPVTLMESELFGYVRGAFTDARRGGKQGVFEYAGKGTVFLDEIGEIPLEMQSRLLRVLQDGDFMRLGDDRLVKARCRIISATNKELEEAVRQGAFRQDLYYRLNILRLNIPSLRERRGDIRDLARTFLEKFCAKYGKISGKITPEALKILMERKWDGNVRELQAVIERYVVLCAADHVHLEASGLYDILEEDQQAGQAAGQARRAPSDEEIRQALEEHRHSIIEAAAALGVHRTTLWRRLKRARRT